MNDVMLPKTVETHEKAAMNPDLHGKPNLTADYTDKTDLRGSGKEESSALSKNRRHRTIDKITIAKIIGAGKYQSDLWNP